jgi:very-short-patch-repair endonuclease
LPTFHRARFEKLCRVAFAAWPSLREFDGDGHDRLVEEFRDADEARLKLARLRALLRHHDELPKRVAGAGGTGVLLSELERKRGHRSPRRLLRDAGTVVQAIKPIFMMSPLSVAQFLEPGGIDFDLLVVDEASQVQPVDAFGAFARSRQRVVVGDAKQLPPTRFFAKLTSNDEEERDEEEEPAMAQAKDVESILGLCAARGMGESMLRWHYRSRHQSLIAVSNHEFYEGKLFVVPSPSLGSDARGLSLRLVRDAVYDRGKTSTNRVEARAVCAAVVEHARTRPEDSLGVAAFSMAQQRAILDELELVRRDHPELEDFLAAHPFEPFFVKNLENVQGDERDAIFLSVGYGPDATGKVVMNFGPLGGDGGERRLNVLISRAKSRCVVFSSIRADQIDLSRAKGRGVSAFKTFLQYAESGRLSTALPDAREEDSPFEVAVRRAIEPLGYEVHPQVGEAGFFVDLGVVDPDRPGRYLLGVECDGAAYHSSLSARDRDRLRQAILENHGWTIHRVWSVDWFQRPNRELEKIVAALEAAKAERLDEERRALEALPPPPRPVSQEEGVTRVNSEAAAEPALAEPYVVAAFDVPRDVEPHLVDVATMAAIVRRVVDIEGPIHETEVVARVRDLWGLGRAGSRIQQAVGVAIERLKKSGACRAEESCLDLPDRPVRVRDRDGAPSSSLRKQENLPPSELRAAALAFLRACHGANRDDAVAGAIRLLGFKSVSAGLRQVGGAAVDQLLASGDAQEVGGAIRAAVD